MVTTGDPPQSGNLEGGDGPRCTNQEPGAPTDLAFAVGGQNNEAGQESYGDGDGSTEFPGGHRGSTESGHEEIGAALSDCEKAVTQSEEQRGGEIEDDQSTGFDGAEENCVKLHGNLEDKTASALPGKGKASPGSPGEVGDSVGSQGKKKRPTESTNDETGSGGEDGETESVLPANDEKASDGTQSGRTGLQGAKSGYRADKADLLAPGDENTDRREVSAGDAANVEGRNGGEDGRSSGGHDENDVARTLPTTMASGTIANRGANKVYKRAES